MLIQTASEFNQSLHHCLRFDIILNTAHK
ncbi:hypothetical protein BCEP4_880004 [Burkholderia cepacia]|nr:hypothetical protein BCEP4_880004 [Burkholderia cepacia]